MKKRRIPALLLCALLLCAAFSACSDKEEAEKPIYGTNTDGEQVQKLTSDELASIGDREIPFESVFGTEHKDGRVNMHVVDSAEEADVVLQKADIDYEEYSVVPVYLRCASSVLPDMEYRGVEIAPVLLLEKDGGLVAVFETNSRVHEEEDVRWNISYYLRVKKSDIADLDDPMIGVSVYNPYTYGTNFCAFGYHKTFPEITYPDEE